MNYFTLVIACDNRFQKIDSQKKKKKKIPKKHKNLYFKLGMLPQLKHMGTIHIGMLLFHKIVLL